MMYEKSFAVVLILLLLFIFYFLLFCCNTSHLKVNDSEFQNYSNLMFNVKQLLQNDYKIYALIKQIL